MSNFHIKTSGSTTLKADEQITANDGFVRSGSWTFDAGEGAHPNAPEVPDPLETSLQPPNLPSDPGNLVPNANPANTEPCYANPEPGWSGSGVLVGRPGCYSGSGLNCVRVGGVGNHTYTFPNGSYRFDSGAGLDSSYRVEIDDGVWNFNGGSGIRVGGSSGGFEMQGGEYAFFNGAKINIGGSAPGNEFGGTFYFHGGGGIEAGGSNITTLNPGTFVFDGGPGMTWNGSSRLHFNPGDYEFWFLGGADMTFNGSSYITADPGAYVKMYFYGSNNNFSDLSMSGSTDMNMPGGEYYFDRGRFLASGSSNIMSDNIFLYFTNGGHLSSNGSAKFGFQAPTTMIYPGYYPGVFMYSDRDNTATFEWTGSTSSVSTGIVYLPSSKVKLSGSSNQKAFEGQFIADSFETGGSNGTVIEFFEYVETAIPTVYLVN